MTGSCRSRGSAALCISLLALAVSIGAVQAQPKREANAEPLNLDLEQGQPGGVPEGWISTRFNEQGGYRVELVAEGAASGERCARIVKQTPPDARNFGNLMQVVDAAPYRGKRIRFRASVRTKFDGGMSRAQLWLRVDRANEGRGFFDNMGDRPIVTNTWKEFEIVGDVADDAEDVNFGLMLMGRGTAWLDAVSIEIVGRSGEGNLPPRALEGRGLDNLVAFARLLGYVRYFHPTEAVATADWDVFAIDGVQAVEGASDPAGLAASLEALFRPLAPTVRVFPTGSEPPLPAELSAPPGDTSPKLVYWLHDGVGMGNQRSIYSSRIIGTRSGEREPPRPHRPFRADLGGGVSCIVPLALYAKSEAATGSAESLERHGAERPQGWAASGEDRPSRLAAVVLAWNVFQHFYPYFDVVQADWPATLRHSLAQAAVDEGERAFLDTMRRLVAGIHDGHGRVSHQSDEATHRVPVLWDWIEESLVVTRAAEEGAEELRPGDVVLTVDGKPAGEALRELESTISGATPQWIRNRSLAELARGTRGSKVTLAVRNAGGEERTVTLSRTMMPWGEEALAEQRPEPVAELEPGMLYVDMGRIDDAVFKEAVPRMAQAKGVVFDMRGYPRFNFSSLIAHLIDEPVTSAQWHVPRPALPDREEMDYRFSNWTVQPARPRIEGKVTFLTHGGAISAAETFMGIVEHYGLGAIVGSPTAGTNGNVNPFSVPGGYHISWTGMRVLKHDGSQHHGIGILPTIPVERTIRGVAAGRDEQLERAVKAVKGSGG